MFSLDPYSFRYHYQVHLYSGQFTSPASDNRVTILPPCPRVGEGVMVFRSLPVLTSTTDPLPSTIQGSYPFRLALIGWLPSFLEGGV